jgi:hypothetical protein
LFDMSAVPDAPPAVVISHETNPATRDSNGQPRSIREQFATALTPGSIDIHIPPPGCCITPPAVAPASTDRD